MGSIWQRVILAVSAKEYRVEYSNDDGNSWGIEATVPHPKPCTSPLQLGITRYLAPGEKWFRVFASDRSGNVSQQPSDPASYLVKPPLIGNPGGQVEEAIPPSPYKPVPVTPPPAPIPVPTPPVPPPVAKPGPLTGLQAVDLAQTSGMLQFDPVEGAGADTVGVRYFGKMNHGAAYGELSGVYRFTTLPVPVPVPGPQPVPPPSITLNQALQSGLDTCLKNKLAHTACMKALSEAIGKVAP